LKKFLFEVKADTNQKCKKLKGKRKAKLKKEGGESKKEKNLP